MILNNEINHILIDCPLFLVSAFRGLLYFLYFDIPTMWYFLVLLIFY